MYAAARGDESSVIKLLKKGADRWIKDLNGNNASFFADKYGFTALATLLRNDPSRTLVHDVIRKNDFDSVVALFKQNVDPNMQRMIDISSSIESTKDDIINHETPLIVAARYNRVEILSLLLKAPDIKINLADSKGWYNPYCFI
jgi:ankyrin repeat protein